MPDVDPRHQRDIDAALKEQERRDEEIRREEHRRYVRQCYLETFTSPKGKVVLEDLRVQFYDVDGYVPGFPYDSHALACSRNVVLRILTMLKEEEENRGRKERQTEAET